MGNISGSGSLTRQFKAEFKNLRRRYGSAQIGKKSSVKGLETREKFLQDQKNKAERARKDLKETPYE